MKTNLESVPDVAAYRILTAASKEHEMAEIVRLIGYTWFTCALVFALVLGRALPAHAEEPANAETAAPAPDDAAPAFDPATAEPGILAERYFDEAQRFDAFL